MNTAFAFEASIIKEHCDALARIFRREGGNLDRLDGRILDDNYVEATAANGLKAVAADLRKLADEIEQRTEKLETETLLAAE